MSEDTEDAFDALVRLLTHSNLRIKLESGQMVPLDAEMLDGQTLRIRRLRESLQRKFATTEK